MTTDFYVDKGARCESENVKAGTRIWGFSHVQKGAVVGEKCNIGEHVYVETGAIIGDRCTIKNGVAVWDCITLEDDVFIGPYVVFTNDFLPRAFVKRGRESFRPTLVKRGATLGANSTIVCGVTIGEFAMIGAGSVIIRDVPGHALIVGNPGHVIGRVCFCGEKLDSADFCSACRLPLPENSLARLLRPQTKKLTS